MKANKLIEKQYDISYIDDIKVMSDNIKIIIKTLLLFHFEKQKNDQDILKAVQEGKYNDIPKLSAIGYHLSYNSIEKGLKEDLWSKAPDDILLKIVENQPFEVERAWSDNVIIPSFILPDLKWKEFASTNPKANIARKLGAKIIS